MTSLHPTQSLPSATVDRPPKTAQPTRIVVISLPTDVQRRSSFAEHARATGLSWRFFDAYDTLHPELEYHESDAIVALGRQLTPGEIGCYSSHYAVWAAMRDQHIHQCVVLEDDVRVDWAFMRRLVATDMISEGLPYVRLFYRLPVAPRILRPFAIPRHFVVSVRGYVVGTQGYVITRPAALRLLNHARRVRRPVDFELDRAWDHGIPNLAIFPFPIFEEVGDSSIGPERKASAVPIPASLWARRARAGLAESSRLRCERILGVIGYVYGPTRRKAAAWLRRHLPPLG